MAHPQAFPKVSRRGKARRNTASSRSIVSDMTPSETNAPTVVVFTSFDGTVREVEDLPLPLGRATALANETAAGKIWGNTAEEAACLAMQKE